MHTTVYQFETYCKLGREVLPLMACAGGLRPKSLGKSVIWHGSVKEPNRANR